MTSHILVVEDEAKLAQFIKMELEFEKYQVTHAVDGFSGLSTAREIKPDLILLDVMMPEMDGIETLSRLKNNNKTSAIPVIFLTAKAQAEEKNQFQKLGVVDVITKPFNSMTLASQVAKILGWEI